MNNIKGKKILVTGGAGFIGSHIVDELVNLNCKVVVLDDLSSGKLANINYHGKTIEFIHADFRDDKALEQALSGTDCVCHQAALRSVPKSVERPYDYNEVNVSGTLKLFIKARDKGIKRIVCASSSSVYGERVDFPEKETDATLPISPYAASKLIVEQYSHVFNVLYGMEIFNLRYFNVFGPRQALDDQYAVVIPKFIHSLLHNQQPPIFGNGKQSRDFTFVTNVVEANVCCLEHSDLPVKPIFNVACGIPHTVNELFETIAGIVGSSTKPKYLPIRKGDVFKTHADISRLLALGWKPKINFEQGLRKSVEYFKKIGNKE